MINARAFAARNPKAPLAPFKFDRREPGDHDVLIEVLFCGVCHSDIHQVRDEWGGAEYPMVPGHEIVGRVKRVGSKVKRFKAGDLAGVGCIVDSCRECDGCKDGFEQFCENGFTGTYNSRERNGSAATQGGYSDCIVTNEDYVLKIPAKMAPELARVAPLLCAGITTFSPFRHWKIGPGKKVGVVGLGGLGHMGVKLAHAMGAHVTVFTTSSSKKEDARRLGADAVVLSKDAAAMAGCTGTLDFILDTVSAAHDLNAYLRMLRRDGTMCLVGIPDKPAEVEAFSVIAGRHSLSGSGIGGIAETQEMLDYCAEHGVLSDIELIPMQEINEAFERTVRGDVKYRFVIDMKSL